MYVQHFLTVILSLFLAVKSDLSRARFVANSVKSIWVPVQSLKWLGYQRDLKHNLLFIPLEKTDRTISNMLVFGNVCKLMTKAYTGLSIEGEGGN